MIGKTIYIPAVSERQDRPWALFRRYAGLVYKAVSVDWFKKFIEIASAITEPAGRAVILSEPEQACVQECGEISVLSANLWHDFPKFRNLNERMESFARLVEHLKPDLILAQEVTRIAFMKADEWLADRLGMAYIYSRANGNDKVGFEEGVGVYSRFPLGTPYLKQFSSALSPLTRRLGVGAPVKTPCGELLVFNVHLSLTPFLNRRQIPQVQDWIAKIAGGCTSLVGGDFNTAESSVQIRRICTRWIDTFRHLHPDADGATHETRWPWGNRWRKRLDYIFICPGNLAWQVLDTRVLENPFGSHSDHLAVFTRLAPVKGSKVALL